jgi:hypothetical protein
VCSIATPALRAKCRVTHKPRVSGITWSIGVARLAPERAPSIEVVLFDLSVERSLSNAQTLSRFATVSAAIA